MKTGKISHIDAIGVSCPCCGGDCASPHNGSLMITADEYPLNGVLLVTCIECGTECRAPVFPGARKPPPTRKI